MCGARDDTTGRAAASETVRLAGDAQPPGAAVPIAMAPLFPYIVGFFPNDDVVVRLVGALILETNDKWTLARRYMGLTGCPPHSVGDPTTGRNRE
jgi:hypothetical protein